MVLNFPVVNSRQVYTLGGETYLCLATIIFDTGRISANLTPLRGDKNLIIPWDVFVSLSGAQVSFREIEVPFEWHEKVQDILDGEVQKLSNVELMGEFIWLGNIPLSRATQVEKLGF